MAEVIRYWDSVCFLGILNEEEDKYDICLQNIEQAEQGLITIVTSAITLAEVVRLAHLPRLDRKNEENIHKVFQNTYIEVRDCTRMIAEKARNLMWNYEHLQYKDAIHVATACFYKIKVLNTFDKDLLKIDNEIPIDQSVNLRICKLERISSEDMFELDQS